MYANTMSDSDTESSEEHSSSECSTDSSDDDKLEMVKVNNDQVLLPQGLCEKKDIFNEFFARSWSALGEANQKHLRQFLPRFPANEEQEQNVTLQRLFRGENFKFSSPLDNFYEHLRDGHYRPDIAKMRYLIRKAERKESLWRHRKYKEHLQAEIIESRKHLLRTMTNLPPGVEPSPPKSTSSTSKPQNPMYHRTKRRYFDILASIKSKVDEAGFSSDDNYPEGAPTPVSRKDKRVLNTIKNSQVLNGEKVVISTIASKAAGFDLEKNVEPNHNPYVMTEQFYRQLLQEHRKRKFEVVSNEHIKDLNIRDVIERARVNYNKREKLVKPEVVQKPVKRKIKKEERSYCSEMNFSSSDSDSTELVSALATSKIVTKPTTSTIPAKTTMSTKMTTTIQATTALSTNVPAQLQQPLPSFNSFPLVSSSNNNPPPTPVKTEGKKKMKIEHRLSPKAISPVPPPPVLPSLQPAVKSEVKSSPPPPPPLLIKTEDIKIESEKNEFVSPTLSELDMMKLPIDLHDFRDNIDDFRDNMIEISKVELMQDTHANYLALIRDVICSTPEHRMDMASLQEKLRAWQGNPITALNHWYCMADNWLHELQSAINFLSGNFPEQPDEFVPYIEFKASLNKYQWIGAGRDSDNLLTPLFQYWLEHKSEMKPVISIKEKEEDTKDDIDLDLDRSLTPPPPRCPTDWQVRKADAEEVRLFREQERHRYDNPHKSFTYRCNGYESVVGPLKGIYSPSSSNTKARGHTMLNADRPNFVTILSLVRDAAARLPNGEGTRAEICELLKCSQYISNAAPDNLLQSVVSGALDRMHTQYDPCVKYDSKRKIWIYLHRNRSEVDFDRLHQQVQTMNKQQGKKKKSPAKPKTPKGDKKSVKNVPPSVVSTVTTSVSTLALTTPSTTISTSKTPKISTVSTLATSKISTVASKTVITSTLAMSSPISTFTASNSITPSSTSVVLTKKEVPQLQNDKFPEKTKEGPKQQTSLLINHQSQHQTHQQVASNLQLHKPLHQTMQQQNSTVSIVEDVKHESRLSTPPVCQQLLDDLSQDEEICQALQAITQQPVPATAPPQVQQIQHQQQIQQQQSLVTSVSSHQQQHVQQIVVQSTAAHKVTKQANKKSVVKIITSNQGAKSLIIPSSANTMIKQDVVPQMRNVITTTKVNHTPIITQQLLQNIVQQKQLSQQQLIRVEMPETKDSKKANLAIQQQILQSISPQQLPNIKNVTLLRNVRQTPTSLVLAQSEDMPTTSTEAAKVETVEANHIPTPIRVQQGTLTLSQQQQLLQSIRQKNIVAGGAQQVLIRHKAPLLQKGGQAAPGTSLLGQARVVTDVNSTNKTTLTSNQGPIVAKVLTNSAGQVISVESLLAHQKQHGLSQGTTLRVSGIKGGPNIIQLGSPQNKTSTTAVAQVAGSQNNFITLTNQAKMVLSSTATTNATTTVTASKPATKTVTKTQTIGKFSQKVSQQIISAKFIAQNIDTQKTPKVIIGPNQIKLTNKNAKPIGIQTAAGATNANSIRMVNTANLNLAHLGGKPVLLASKGSSLQGLQQAQNVIIQTQANSGASLLAGNTKSANSNATVNVIGQGGQPVVLAPQLKVQPQVLLSSNVKGSNLLQNQSNANQIIVGGHPVRLASTSSGGSTQRVVLASQGQGGQLLTQQILLPAGFQGTAINIKSLQGVKVIPLPQQAKGFQGRQVFARVMSPSNIVRTATVSAADVQQTTPTSE